MAFHLLSKRSFFKDLPIRAIHSHFFHGKALRGGEFPTTVDYRVLHPVDIPLGLHKNVFRIANLFAPEFELVVSDSVANDLAQISNLKLVPVSFEVLYEYPFVPGDLGCGFKTHDQQMRFIDRQKHVPALRHNLQPYHHIVMPPIREIRLLYPDVGIQITHDREPLIIPVSDDVLEEIPLFSLGATTILRSDVFEILEPHVDRLYFEHQRFNLDS